MHHFIAPAVRPKIVQKRRSVAAQQFKRLREFSRRKLVEVGGAAIGRLYC